MRNDKSGSLSAKRHYQPENKKEVQKVGEQTLRNGTVRDVLHDKPADRPPCKGCGNEPKRDGSAYGANCSTEYKAARIQERRRNLKIKNTALSK